MPKVGQVTSPKPPPVAKRSLPVVAQTGTPFQRHVARWSSCKSCELAGQRSKVCHFRGAIPCDVLLIGEAPGQSEDVLGRPFVGPAGQLLDQMVSEASAGGIARVGYANLVGCFPREAKDAGTNEPSDESIKACVGRLAEIVAMTRPRIVVRVGKLATKWVNKFTAKYGIVEGVRSVDVIHPAAILRMDDPVQKDHHIRTTVVRIKTAMDECGLIPF